MYFLLLLFPISYSISSPRYEWTLSSRIFKGEQSMSNKVHVTTKAERSNQSSRATLLLTWPRKRCGTRTTDWTVFRSRPTGWDGRMHLRRCIGKLALHPFAITNYCNHINSALLLFHRIVSILIFLGLLCLLSIIIIGEINIMIWGNKSLV